MGKVEKPLKKILVAEDEPDIQSVIKIVLEDLGEFTIKICSSGVEIMQEIDEFKPDLVLLDVMMPRMDGMTTLAEMRKRENLKNIPVIFVTAKNQIGESAHFLQLGAISVISKPFDPMALSDELRMIWRNYNG